MVSTRSLLERTISIAIGKNATVECRKPLISLHILENVTMSIDEPPVLISWPKMVCPQTTGRVTRIRIRTAHYGGRTTPSLSHSPVLVKRLKSGKFTGSVLSPTRAACIAFHLLIIWLDGPRKSISIGSPGYLIFPGSFRTQSSRAAATHVCLSAHVC